MKKTAYILVGGLLRGDPSAIRTRDTLIKSRFDIYLRCQ